MQYNNYWSIRCNCAFAGVAFSAFVSVSVKSRTASCFHISDSSCRRQSHANPKCDYVEFLVFNATFTNESSIINRMIKCLLLRVLEKATFDVPSFTFCDWFSNRKRAGCIHVCTFNSVPPLAFYLFGADMMDTKIAWCRMLHYCIIYYMYIIHMCIYYTYIIDRLHNALLFAFPQLRHEVCVWNMTESSLLAQLTLL